MKTSDIKVGTDYAYRTHAYASPKQVTVLETGVERQEGYRYSGRKVRNGVRVRFAKSDGETVVTSRQIEQTWESYVERKRASDECRRQRAEAERAEHAERARQARALDEYLAGHGVEAREMVVWNTKVRDALEAVGYEFTDKAATRSRVHLLDFVRHGQVSVDDLGPVLADLALKVEV